VDGRDKPGHDDKWRQAQKNAYHPRMTRAKAISAVAILFATLVLSACDRCGDPVAQNGNHIMACKGEKPSLH
jgi:hypothetical protein